MRPWLRRILQCFFTKRCSFFYASHLLAKRYLLSLHTAARSMPLRSIEYDGGRLFVARGLILFGGGQRLKA